MAEDQDREELSAALLYSSLVSVVYGYSRMRYSTVRSHNFSAISLW